MGKREAVGLNGGTTNSKGMHAMKPRKDDHDSTCACKKKEDLESFLGEKQQGTHKMCIYAAGMGGQINKTDIIAGFMQSTCGCPDDDSKYKEHTLKDLEKTFGSNVRGRSNFNICHYQKSGNRPK